MTERISDKRLEEIGNEFFCFGGGDDVKMLRAIQELYAALVAERAEVEQLKCEPHLGCATNAQLLEELTVRADIHGWSTYRTVDGESWAKAQQQPKDLKGDIPMNDLREYRKTATVLAYQARSSGVIHTLEGDHFYEAGDYICRGIAGEKWPVKREIFEATYELVNKEVT